MTNLILVFLAALAVDGIWAAYIISTAKKQAYRASILSGLIILVSAYMTLSYLEDKRTILVAALGGMCGTFLTIKLQKKDPAACDTEE